MPDSVKIGPPVPDDRLISSGRPSIREEETIFLVLSPVTEQPGSEGKLAGKGTRAEAEDSTSPSFPP